MDYSSDPRFIRIADFGLIALHKYAQQTHTPDKGDITYAAPEVLNGGDYDTKSDIYGLGKVMKKLLSIRKNKY
jgi:serine/threonine protein kinase